MKFQFALNIEGSAGAIDATPLDFIGLNEA